MPNLDLYTAFDISIRIIAAGVVLSSFELIAIRHQFSSKGVFSVGAVSPFYGASNMLKIVDRWLSIILITQVAASTLLVLTGPFSAPGRIMYILCLLTALATRWRRYSGGDGAEQMNMIVLMAAALALFPNPSTGRITMVVIFIAAQASLSYLTAGIAKLISPLWRSGHALPAILSTYTHGNQGVAAFLHQHHLLALIASWGVIVFECLFPLLILGPDWILLATLLSGLTFHVLCAFWMGLNSFLWSFPALYPCVIAAVKYL